jgi:hypothetical protein
MLAQRIDFLTEGFMAGLAQQADRDSRNRRCFSEGRLRSACWRKPRAGRTTPGYDPSAGSPIVHHSPCAGSRGCAEPISRLGLHHNAPRPGAGDGMPDGASSADLA